MRSFTYPASLISALLLGFAGLLAVVSAQAVPETGIAPTAAV